MSDGTDDAQTRDEAPLEDTSPNELLAGEVVAALVAEGLISAADGESVNAQLADGSVDGSKWRFIFENHLQRKAERDERE